jgi:hypothetical protein
MPIETQMGSGIIALLMFNLDTRCGWMVNATPCPIYLWERALVPIVQEAGWAPGPDWTGSKNPLAEYRYPKMSVSGQQAGLRAGLRGTPAGQLPRSAAYKGR